MKLQPRIIELLNKRGIESEEDIEEYLSDKPQKTYDPFLLLNMEAGVDLILSAIDSDIRICIYGDYDADGITSTVIMYEVLSRLTDDLMYYIPSRFDEGYGMNCAAIDRISKAGAGLIVTVDCGSVSCEEVDYARSLGMEVLVTDHHTISDKKSDCLIINPTQKECPYPFKYLAGCGVAFKVAQAIVTVTGLPKEVLTRTLDLVGIGTIGDIVPLVDENRTLAKYGLRAINTSARRNLQLLIECTGLHPGKVTAENVSFVIVPHLNAAGRMEHAKLAVEMFLSEDEESARAGAMKLARCNTDRKRIQEEVFQHCITVVEESYVNDSFLVLELEDAHEGITGIVAGKLKDRYYKPVIIVTPTGDGNLKGTGRSIDGINIYDMLKDNEDLFIRFGGHAAACGFTMDRTNIDILRQNLNDAADQKKLMDPSLFDRRMGAELELSPEDVNFQLVEQLELLEPCGCANERPLTGIVGAPENVGRMGNQGQYLRFAAILGDGRRLPCVVFHDADSVDAEFFGAKRHDFNIIGNLNSRIWNGSKTLQMTVEHVESI